MSNPSTAGTCGEVIAGESSALLIRQKSDKQIEIGDLLVEDREDGYILLQVYDLMYGSQIPQVARELIAGMTLEGYGKGLELVEPNLRNYVLAVARAILRMTDAPHVPKILPATFGSVRNVQERDLSFLTRPVDSIHFGKVRSGSKILSLDVYLDGIEVFSHHILIPATTGRGKSNLVKVMIWSVLDKDYCGILILDPHNEYYGKNETLGLRNHPRAKDYLRYYSANPGKGALTLMINIRTIRPNHFNGIIEFSEPQREAMSVAYSKYKEKWIENIFSPKPELPNVQLGTIGVLQRKLGRVLGIDFDEDEQKVKFRTRVFTTEGGEATINDIIKALEESKKVIIDTSALEDQAELLIGSIVANDILNQHKWAKEQETLRSKPVVSIVIEEAPRVLGDQTLASGANIYSDIAREGRKFKIGLIAITQLTSVIPKTVLANMNTKIILGNELSTERRSIIESASQDLSSDDKNIASLDKGEAIISSNFTKFAVPIAIPLFDDVVKSSQQDIPKTKPRIVT